MKVTTRHTPSFGVARVELGGGEHIKVESGAMYAMSAGVALESRMEGGSLKAAKRLKPRLFMIIKSRWF